MLSANAQRWLKCIHVFFSCAWVGAAICLITMNFSMEAASDMELYGINMSMKFIDDYVIIPGAMGCFLTGLIYSLFTNWGWFKHRWITVKWIVNIWGVVFGTFWLGPWLNSLPEISKAEGLKALTNPIYINNKTMLYWWGSLQALSIIFAVFISVLKPWKKKS